MIKNPVPSDGVFNRSEFDVFPVRIKQKIHPEGRVSVKRFQPRQDYLPGLVLYIFSLHDKIENRPINLNLARRIFNENL